MFAAVAATVLVACSKVEEGVNLGTGKYTIAATIGDAQTRTSYVDETADPAKGLKVEWEANETTEGCKYFAIYPALTDGAKRL